MKGTLTKTSSNPGAPRTKSMDGEFAFLPKVGQYFVMTGESLDPNKDFRLWRTSEITKVSKANDGLYVFTTLNSEYTLTIKGEQ